MSNALTRARNARMPPLSSPRRLDKASLRAWTLLLLRMQPGHGYDVSAALGRRGLPEPDRAGLYRLLHALEEEGLVRSSWQPSEDGPERRVYRVTGKGTRQLRRDAAAMLSVRGDVTTFVAEYEVLSSRLARRRRRG